MTKFESSLKDYKEALNRLKEVLSLPEKNDIIRDSTIQRFEIVFDLAWKTLKAFLEEKQGIRCAAPKSCFREAYSQGFLKYDEFWLAITDLRNETAHTYSMKKAEEVFEKIPKCFEYFDVLLKIFEGEVTPVKYKINFTG